MKTSNEKRANTVALYMSGMSSKAVGKQVGVSPVTVLRWVVEAGEQIRHRGWGKGRRRAQKRKTTSKLKARAEANNQTLSAFVRETLFSDR